MNQVPATLVSWITEAQLPVRLLLLGIDPLSAILLLTPLPVPLIVAAGIDPVYFGMIVTVNLAIGLFTPPFGINIFVMQSLFGMPLSAIYRGVVPFLVIYLAAAGAGHLRARDLAVRCPAPHASIVLTTFVNAIIVFVEIGRRKPS
ncbi:TRAP transporter large permease subunit [Mesorhizobium camelthorni]|uniref:TRAP transporter large permease subunit n=1 Tax=Allomesorhizobium camelthorni TaxID=475069 RepID=A0A6G4WDV4_9HYPH|nr:TRAP transporter large permease subunit [Mesorhizobium camelthorni]